MPLEMKITRVVLFFVLQSEKELKPLGHLMRYKKYMLNKRHHAHTKKGEKYQHKLNLK